MYENPKHIYLSTCRMKSDGFRRFLVFVGILYDAVVVVAVAFSLGPQHFVQFVVIIILA